MTNLRLFPINVFMSAFWLWLKLPIQNKIKKRLEKGAAAFPRPTGNTDFSGFRRDYQNLSDLGFTRHIITHTYNVYQKGINSGRLCCLYEEQTVFCSVRFLPCY